jgi:putative transposase
MSYAKAINKQYKRHGSLWQKRFRRIEQRDVSWQQKRLCYIHHNPIHHRYEVTI